MSDHRLITAKKVVEVQMNNKSQVHFSETDYGFEWGSMTIERLMSEPTLGWVIIKIETPKKAIQVYATKTGKLRVFGVGGKEWKEGA